MRAIDKTRRGFLGLMAATPFSARAAAAEAEKLVFRGGMSGHMGVPSTASDAQCGPIGESQWRHDRASYLKDLLDNLGIGGDQHKALREEWRYNVPQLDADIAQMHSVSLTKRIDMQRDRMVAREIEANRRDLKKRLANILNGKPEWD